MHSCANGCLGVIARGRAGPVAGRLGLSRTYTVAAVKWASGKGTMSRCGVGMAVWYAGFGENR